MTESHSSRFDLLEATITEIHAAMEAGRITAEDLVERYLDRIEAYDDAINAILTINDAAIRRARRLDDRFARSGKVGSLHGIPVVLKDNQDTHDMPTTAGSVGLAGSRPPRDAHVVSRLRDAGGIVIAKANLQELSFGIDTISSLGGATRNPYDLDRRPSGSSGGSAAAVAANLAAIGTGSDTCSSVRSPPAFTNLVGLRPTRGLVSRSGIVPISETQDTAGPITRTVEDAARILDVIAGFDPEDPVTARGVNTIPADGYVSHLDSGALEDARIGVARQFFGRHDPASASASVAEIVTSVIEAFLDAVAEAGATIIDDVEVVDLTELESARVIRYEFARDFDDYLDRVGDGAPIKTLAELFERGELAPEVASRLTDGGVLEVDTDSLEHNADYLRRLRRRTELKDRTLACLARNGLDALLYPPSRIPPVRIPEHQPFSEMNCELAAHTGLPSIVLPAGFSNDGLPVGVELLGREFSEPRLFELGYAIEQVTEHRRPPDRFGPLTSRM